MNVVFVDTTITTPPTGGAHTFLVNLCASLVEQRHHVSVVAAPGRDATIPRELQRAGTDVLMNVWSRRHLPEERASRLASWVNRERPDVYIISTSPDAGWVALPFLDPSIATMSIAHANVSAYYGPLSHYGDFIDRAVGVSQQITQEIIRTCGIPADRAVHIPYGVTALSQREFEGRWAAMTAGDASLLRIVYVGRFVQLQKRVLDLAPLAVELSRRDVNFELHLIGDGQERSVLLAKLDRPELSGRIRCWGWLNSDLVSQRLRELDVIVLPSDSEGLPIALLEAMGHGLVPVVSDIRSGITEVIRDCKNGYLAPVGNTSAFADRLEALAGDRVLLRAMSGSAWETSREYSLGRMAQNYISCFRRIREARLTQDLRLGKPTDFPVMPSCRSRYPYWLRKLKQYVLAARRTI